MTADVSVVIPCFNCAPTIGRAVESVARQTELPRQVIMVDDGSPDYTYEALADIQGQYGRDWVHLYRLSANSGPAIARNTGWEAATCGLVAFLDSDDIWHPQKVSRQVNVMKQQDDLGFCGHLWARGDDVSVKEWSDTTIQSVGLRMISAEAILLRNAFVTSSVMIRRECSFRFNPDLRYSQDYALWLEMVLSGVKAAVIKSVLALYFKDLYGHSGQTKNIKNHTNAAHSIYKNLESAGHISTPLRYMLDCLEMVKYQRRRARVTLRPHFRKAKSVLYPRQA